MFYFSFDGFIIANEYEQSMNKTLTYCEKHTKMIWEQEKYYIIYTKTGRKRKWNAIWIAKNVKNKIKM